MRTIAILIALFTISPLLAQNEFGVTLAASRTKLRGDRVELEDLTMRADFDTRVGLLYQFHVKEDVRIRAGLNYMVYKGTLQTLDTVYQISNPINSPFPGQVIVQTQWRDSLDMNIKTLEIPLTLNILSNNDRWAFGSGLIATLPIEASVTDLQGSRNVQEELEVINTSIVFSTEYNIPLGRNTLKVNLSYSQGLFNITSSNKQATSELSRIKPTSVNLGLIWTYKTKYP